MLHFSGRDMPSRPVTSTKDLVEWEEIVRSIADGAIVKAKNMGLASFTSTRSWKNNNASLLLLLAILHVFDFARMRH